MNRTSDAELLDQLEAAAKRPDSALDIDRNRELTIADAYRLQLAWKQRRADEGDPHVGYRISMSSRTGIAEAMRIGLIPDGDPTAIPPIVTSLSASNLGSEDAVIDVAPDRYGYVEAEVGVLIGERLQGPHVTATAALGAVAGFVPAIDLAQIRMTRQWGMVHTLATAATPQDTTIVCGARLTPPPVNLPVEGILVSVNGESRASATAWECLGNPINAVVWLANTLADFGVALEPGQVVITGVCPEPQRLVPGDVTARADFTTLGGVSVRLAVPE